LAIAEGDGHQLTAWANAAAGVMNAIVRIGTNDHQGGRDQRPTPNRL
jgi:hypothetical protein